MQDISFACSTYITGVMGDVQGQSSLFFGYTVMYEILEDALYTRSGPWDGMSFEWFDFLFGLEIPR